jgi:sugar phosphate isomerase/epimerase
MMDKENLSGCGRRRFLAGCIAALGTGVAAKGLFGGEALAVARVALKLGLVTYNWGKDWDVPTIIKNCAQTGFTGVELRSTHRHGVEIELSMVERERVAKLFADSPVEIVGLGSACEYHAVDAAELERNIEETRAFVDLCADVGGSGVKVRPNGLPDGVPVEKTLEQIGKALNQVAAYGAEKGIQIRVEVHGRGTQEIPHMKTIMDIADHPNVVVCWNCNPADLNGLGFAENFQMLSSRMGTVHIHDLRAGKNDYPWKELFPRLVSCDAPGFSGWCLLEDGAVPEDIVAAMGENRKLFDEFVRGV